MKENQIALRAGFLEKEVSFSHGWKLETAASAASNMMQQSRESVTSNDRIRKQGTGIELEIELLNLPNSLTSSKLKSIEINVVFNG